MEAEARIGICLTLLLAGILLLAACAMTLQVASVLLGRQRPEPIDVKAVVLSCVVLKGLGCTISALACAMLAVDMRLPLKGLERLAAMLGMIFFVLLLFIPYPVFWLASIPRAMIELD